MTLSFKTTKKDSAALRRIAQRAARLYRDHGQPRPVLDISMDLTACHANGCPLDLAKMEAAPDADLLHDVGGIGVYINRDTGKLRDCFLPKCAKPETKPVVANRWKASDKRRARATRKLSPV